MKTIIFNSFEELEPYFIMLKSHKVDIVGMITQIHMSAANGYKMVGKVDIVKPDGSKVPLFSEKALIGDGLILRDLLIPVGIGDYIRLFGESYDDTNTNYCHIAVTVNTIDIYRQ